MGGFDVLEIRTTHLEEYHPTRFTTTTVALLKKDQEIMLKPCEARLLLRVLRAVLSEEEVS
jgi:hypothetical protein